MANFGKTYSKTRMKDLLAHYGSHGKIAELIGVTAPTIKRIADGSTTFKPTRNKLDALVKKIRTKKTSSKGNGKFHTLTAQECEIIQALDKKYGEQAHLKLGISDSGFDLLKIRPVGGNIMHKTATLIAEAKVCLKDTKPKGWLLQKIMEQQRNDVSPVDVSQDVTNALVRVEAKINTLLESQEKILNQQAAMLAFQQEFNTAWLT